MRRPLIAFFREAFHLAEKFLLIFRPALAALRRSLPRKPGKSLLRKAIYKRFTEKLLWGCAAGVLMAFLFYFLAGSLVPFIRSRGLSLSLPGDTEAASALNAYLEPSSPEVSEDGFRAPEDAGLGALSLRTHRILSGETISAVAAKAGLNLDTVVSLNHIQDVRRVPEGAEIKLPNQNGILYTVKRGDSLSAIAGLYSVTTGAIADVNGLESATIHPGQELFIPGARMKQDELKKILGELFTRPAAGRLTSPFGMRADPFTGVRRFHNGIDLAGPAGTPIYAAMAGKVAKVGVHPTYGKYIIVSHAGGYQSWYAHLQKPLVAQGKTVVQGQLIGEMGNTGYSTGSHLHFSIFKDGAPVDPLQFLR
ncbi:MAG: M23 family metallopeptidase [Spirochaetales bacterium]|nr:M23 family metallopeptidase [Spirochaetales bacterium]